MIITWIVILCFFFHLCLMGGVVWKVGRGGGKVCVCKWVNKCVDGWWRWTVDERWKRRTKLRTFFFLCFAMPNKLHKSFLFTHIMFSILWVVACSLAVISVIIEKYRSNIHRIQLKRFVIIYLFSGKCKSHYNSYLIAMLRACTICVWVCKVSFFLHHIISFFFSFFLVLEIAFYQWKVPSI